MRLAEPEPTSLSATEYRSLARIVRQCSGYLIGFRADHFSTESFFSTLNEKYYALTEFQPISPVEAFVQWAMDPNDPVRSQQVKVLVRLVDDFVTWAIGICRSADKATAKLDVDGTGHNRDKTGQGKVGKKRLEESKKEIDRLKSQVYIYIQKQHDEGKKPGQILADLRGDKDRQNQVQEAGLTVGSKLVKAAIALPGQRERDKLRKKQDTPSP